MMEPDPRALLPPDHPKGKEYRDEQQAILEKLDAEGALDTQMVMVHKKDLHKCHQCGKVVHHQSGSKG